MNNVRNMKLLTSLVQSQKRRKNYSANTNKIINTYKCNEHNEYFSKICLKCNIDICSRCERNYHNNHQIIKYNDISPDSYEIENLKNKINKYIDKYNKLRNEINNWYNEIKNKIFDFDASIKNNDILNSIDFLANYSNNKICLNTILKFRKLYYNIIEDKDVKNKNIISIFNQYGIIDNLNLPSYYDYFEIKNILHKLNNNKDNIIKKNEILFNYLVSIPYMTNINNISNINYKNDTLSKSSSYYNLLKNPFYCNSNEIKNSESQGDNSTGIRNYDKYNNKTYSENRVIDSKNEEFMNILNKTKIPEFNLNSHTERSNKIYKSINIDDRSDGGVKNFTKYLNKIGLLNLIKNDLQKENSCQDLLNKSSCSIKSTKYVYNRSNSSFNLNLKNNNNKTYGIKTFGIKSSLLPSKYDNISVKTENKEKEKENNKITFVNKSILTNKNVQSKTYVHKKFTGKNNILRVNGNKKTSIYNIKFQKKKMIINKPNTDRNNLTKIEKNEYIQEIVNDNENKYLNTDNNYNKEKDKDNMLNNNFNIINHKVVRTKQTNDEILKDNERSEKIYSSPIKSEMFKNAIISDAKKIIVNDYDNDNEESNINSTEKKNLLHIIFSPSANQNQSTNKKNGNIINYQTYKINNNRNINFNPPNIVKTNKNSPFFVDPEKELCIGLELGNSECRVGIVNQNTSEIQLVCFDEEKYSIPTLVSFAENKKEIKIGYKAEEDIINNPSQTIFNIVKFFGKKFNDIKARSQLWPFKIYYTNDENNKPYIKINFGPQKDKIFYFENILSIFLEKMFENIFNNVNLENSSKYNTQEKLKEGEEDYIRNTITLNTILVITVPNYFSYYQRKLIEKIFKDEIFPEINDNEFLKIYGNYKINLIGLKIENASSIASLCLCNNYDYNNLKNNNNNILILNIDGGSANISITSSVNENDKSIYQVKVMNGLCKGGTDIIDDFMIGVLDKFEKNARKEILDSSLALAKLRKLCERLSSNLLKKEKDSFNMVEILDNYDSQIEINKMDYQNSSSEFFNNIKSLIYDSLNEAKLNERNISDAIFIGELCREKKLLEIIEHLFRQDNFIYEDLIYSNYMNNDKDFYIVGGAAYHAINYNNNNIYTFYDISPYNIGIEKYNGSLDYIVMKGEKIPIKNQRTIKVENEKELKIYEKDENKDGNNNKLIGKIQIENNIQINMDNIKYGYKEIKIEYEINDKLEIFIRLFNGENYSNEIKVNLLYDNYIK